jgi:glycosyltransferase involved in cell wall biosynthesis
MSLQRRAVLWNISRLASRTARLVATVSNFSRDELVRWYKLPVSKIRVIYCGPGSSLNAVPASRTGENAFEISGPYIAVIGGEYPHKNIARLVKAYGRIASKINHKLVIAGLIPQDVAKLIKGLNLQSIIVTGYLSRAELREAIAGSDLFVMPSLYEGFGAPVLEAQGLGVPVACSSAGSLPEIMGGSAVLFDPKDIDAMGTAIARCVSDRALNSELRTLGRENFARFTWRNTADAYSSCYRELMNWKSKPRSSR